ncbi:hypothetical protein FJQ54_12110 [Sandaracinobacter neustonicus]|uniref:Flagellar assembly protein FliH/Type III secretion system HrpE domain-containing protein n=1 Tax=Sandaracinobacter neustonicus TaxID=1715348 RepID=A0A501XIP6_9SPHN|nr:FliH/SctL family protein [Sandaracinobacter neustonicus]TPE60147.1 hypothetical protein FJQ54_12110 [Sandaracinobacter neustonicus]
MSEARPIPLARLFRTAPLPPAPPSEAEVRASAEAHARAEADAEWGAHVAALEAAHAAELARVGSASAQQQVLSAELVAALEGRFAQALASLAFDIARQLMAAEPSLPSETLHMLIAEALAALPEGAAGVLHLAPDSLPHVTPPPGWRLHADPSLQQGSIRAEAGPALARASLPLRLEALAARIQTPPGMETPR